MTMSVSIGTSQTRMMPRALIPSLPRIDTLASRFQVFGEQLRLVKGFLTSASSSDALRETEQVLNAGQNFFRTALNAIANQQTSAASDALALAEAELEEVKSRLRATGGALEMSVAAQPHIAGAVDKVIALAQELKRSSLS